MDAKIKIIPVININTFIIIITQGKKNDVIAAKHTADNNNNENANLKFFILEFYIVKKQVIIKKIIISIQFCIV